MTLLELEIENLGYELQFWCKRTWQDSTGSFVIKLNKDKTEIKSFKVRIPSELNLENYRYIKRVVDKANEDIRKLGRFIPDDLFL